MQCHCGSETTFEACCSLLITGEKLPVTAEALMRSRYSAHVVGAIEYVMATHDPETVKSVNRAHVQNWSDDADWKRLEIVKVTAGHAEDDVGEVEFIAWFIINNALSFHHERSIFRRIDGRWFYVAGMNARPDGKNQKIGRNEQCPCGSGRKFKVCHGRNDVLPTIEE